MAKKETNKSSIYIMTDEEFDALKLKEDKSTFLDELSNASKPKKFSVSNMNKKKPKRKSLFGLEPNEKAHSFTELCNEFIPDKPADGERKFEGLNKHQWDSLIEEFDELSPIDDITYADRLAYRHKKQGDKFDEMFSKEQSMLNDLLSGLQKRSKTLDKKIDSLTGKGSYGIAKNFSDLLEVSNTVEKTKLDVIKELVNIKKTATDLRMKDLKNNPDNDIVEDKDTIADKFYKSIISGKSNEFIQSSMSGYSDNVLQDSNISQPMSFNGDTSYNLTSGLSSYIENETRNVKIYVCQHDDGTNEFIAIDEDGVIIEDYDIPSDDLLASLSIKPGSKFAYDIYSRKYPIIGDQDIMAPIEEDNTDYDEYDKYSYANDAENDIIYDDDDAEY